MAFLPVGSSRVPDALISQLTTRNILDRQRELTITMNQLSTGELLNLPSDDPYAAVQGAKLLSAVEQNEQFQTNIESGVNVLSTVEQSLISISDAIDEARSLGLQYSSDTATDAEREAAASQIDAIVDSLLSVVNQQYMGEYLFAGQEITETPFTRDSNGITYTGDQGVLSALSNYGITFNTTVTPDSSIGTDSSAGQGGDLDPVIVLGTRLSELNDGEGVTLGEIILDDGASGSVRVDLSSADNIGDVIDMINDASTGITASINAAGNGLQLTSTGTVTVSDVQGGTTAKELGILASAAASPVVGGDLDPVVSLTTPLAALNGGAGIDQTSGLQIDNGPYSATIDLSAAVTVEDMLNTINSAGVRVRAEINEDNNGISVVSVYSGGDFSITETALTGTTAADLDIRTTNLDTLLADFNGGAGVSTIEGADIQITDRNGATYQVDLSNAKTVGDVKDAIETATGGVVLVDENPLGGIRLTDTTGGAGNFIVESMVDSAAAENLGILADVASSTILGTNNHQASVDGVFDTLLRLRDALADNDLTEIALVTSQLDDDRDRVLSAEGTVAARLSVMDSTATRVSAEGVQLQELAAQVLEPDFSETVTKLVNQQTALEAALSVTSKVLQGSLFDLL